jgi:Zn-dependent alcohol dehydrogenase
VSGPRCQPALCHRAADVSGSGGLLQGKALLKTAAGDRINHHLEVDVAIEAVGSAKVLADGLKLVIRGGAVVSVGLPHPSAELPVPALQFARAGKRLPGSYMGDKVPSRGIPLYLDYGRQGMLPVELLHTDTKPLAEINEGLDVFVAGDVVRRLFQA